MQFNQNSIQPTPTSALMSVVDTQGTNLGLDSSLASPTSGSADVWPLTRETPRSAHITIYESSIAFLREACCRTDQDTSILHQLSLIADDIVSAIIESVHCRRVLLQLSSEIGLANNSDWRNALQLDERRIATHLETIFSSKSAEGPVLVLKGESAQCFLDVVQDTLNRGLLITPEQSRRARRIIRKLSEASDSLPSSLFVTAVSGRDPHPLFAGGYGDIYRAEYKNKTVALKHMRYFTQTSDLRGIRLKLCREALVWKDLHHSNILTFIGIDRESFPGSLCLVSPWMEHGTVLKYLNDHGLENVDKLLFEIAQGLEYLHSHNVVHGDLRGTNILIKDDWSACLADFGLSVIVSATASVHTSTRAGSPYWMAPELIDPARFGCRYARTPASDVYAFGCVCLEVGSFPFMA
ncbi:kinase-like domain-containing protein [Roridomyces roridus]|uniref:Kinase-like domain-containing protein n=1 Tax=Roridomyces roridus TaxID=1738132 RepID=A0AAD7FGR9_9AGAR|nr:kinase-like domain-containing protein [Roridomyces roridus]